MSRNAAAALALGVSLLASPPARAESAPAADTVGITASVVAGCTVSLSPGAAEMPRPAVALSCTEPEPGAPSWQADGAPPTYRVRYEATSARGDRAGGVVATIIF